MSVLSVSGLEKSFSKNKVLDNICFNINKGEVISILGESGSGKTTLLRCLNFLETSDKGTLTFLDKEYDMKSIKNKDIYDIRIKTAFVFQNYNLFLNKTAIENITEGLIIARKIKKDEAIEKASSLLDSVGLLDKKDFYPNKLSGGQSQRIAILRAIVTSPSLIYFDEPTSALDPKYTSEVLNLIKRLKKEGLTMIIVTHEIEFARNISDRVILMHKGKIVEENNSVDFFNNPREILTKEFLNKA